MAAKKWQNRRQPMQLDQSNEQWEWADNKKAEERGSSWKDVLKYLVVGVLVGILIVDVFKQMSHPSQPLEAEGEDPSDPSEQQVDVPSAPLMALDDVPFPGATTPVPGPAQEAEQSEQSEQSDVEAEAQVAQEAQEEQAEQSDLEAEAQAEGAASGASEEPSPAAAGEDEPPPDDSATEANEVPELVAWQQEFIEVLKARAKDGIVVLAMTNFGDSQTLMVDNLVHSLGHLASPPIDEYLVVATDQQAYDYLQCRGIHSYYDWRILGRNVSTAALGFNPDLKKGANYKDITYAKLDVMNAALASGLHVLMSDTDVVFVRNPLKKLYEASKKFDAQFLWDGKEGQWGGKKGGGGDVQSNSGFYFLNNNERSRKWFEFVMKSRSLKRFQTKPSDQDIVLWALDPPRHGLRYTLLPRAEYLNGFIVKKQTPAKCDTPAVKGKWLAVHMNYNSGHRRKISHFKRCGLWLCEDCKAGARTPSTCVHEGMAGPRAQAHGLVDDR